MKFLIDAQLPKKLVSLFLDLKQEAIHTLDLPKQNTTQDEEINELSCQYQYIVVTKDKDFLDSFILRKKPYKLLLITTGNIKNGEMV
ncbi:DUF5615 family PIN-like protein [Cyanobacterium sp. DS4]|uniref:DUF5615 family PIN-like protein n=1 Tax=Cyanobacterium sp. DS4 TaxID=2878255 RepID=UPI002E7FDFE7|nr:DUF5615 family PIN-like protein [Cyanobacterium sp. Dongsha4]WVL00608.1 DUF5615 family PIN-like protein [Cyanobacterium sp. Dongsha4]